MVELADQVPTVIEAAEAGLEIGYGLYAVCASDGLLQAPDQPPLAQA